MHACMHVYKTEAVHVKDSQLIVSRELRAGEDWHCTYTAVHTCTISLLAYICIHMHTYTACVLFENWLCTCTAVYTCIISLLRADTVHVCMYMYVYIRLYTHLPSVYWHTYAYTYIHTQHVYFELAENWLCTCIAVYKCIISLLGRSISVICIHMYTHPYIHSMCGR